jgi:hypothetical protein
MRVDRPAIRDGISARWPELSTADTGDGTFFNSGVDKSFDGMNNRVFEGGCLPHREGFERGKGLRGMIEEACVAIEAVSERDRRVREAKYARRNKMRYIDRLLNELEMLNLADQREVPTQLAVALDALVQDIDVVAKNEEVERPGTVGAAMDVLYEIQDSLMENPIGDE